MSLICENNSPIIGVNNLGDNVGRDKYQTIYQSIAPESLRQPIELIFSSIREKNFDAAKIQLETIKATSSLNSDSDIILDMVAIHLDLIEPQEKAKIRSSLISFQKCYSDKVSADLCLATLMYLDVENKLVEDARERYQKSNHKSIYSHEKFYELVATDEELENTYENNRLDLGEIELNGIIRGFFRVEKFSSALKVSERLNKVFPSFNSQVLELFAKAIILFNLELKGKHLWLLTLKSKKEIIKITEELISLLNASKISDSRLFNIAIPCLYYQTEHHQTLADICWKNIGEVEKVNSRMAAVIYNIYEKDFSRFEDESERKYEQARHDEKYRKKILEEIYSLKAISIDDFIILREFYDKHKIIQWVKSGDIVIDGDDLEKDIANLELNLITLPTKNNNLAIENIKVQARSFFEKYQNELKIINPFILHKLTTDLLFYPELALTVCDFLKPVLPSSDLWSSPLVRNYLNALLLSEQMVTLNTVLDNIDKTEWDSFVWQVQARMLEHQHNDKEAIISIEEALKLDNSSLNSWGFLIHLHRKLNVSDETICSILQRIPEELFLEKSDMGLSLLVEMAKTGDFQRAEKVIVSWFIANPSNNAIDMSNFGLNTRLGETHNFIPSFESMGCCISGIKFEKDNEVTTKLLVNNISTNHHCLLDINSSLGMLLNEMNPNEIRQYGISDIKLIERLPPYVAAFQISLKLRESQNNGNDCFYPFYVPVDNPDEMIRVMEDKLSRIQNKTNNEDLIKNLDIPLFFKGNFLHKNDPIKAALILLSTKDCVKYPLPNFREDSPTVVALDVYAIAYLAVTGLTFALNKIATKFVITQETKYFIENFLKEISREDYMTLSVRPEGGLLRVTAEDIKQSSHHQKIQNSLNLVMTECEVVTPEVIDTPAEIINVQEFIDYSVSSTIKLSISNNIPWLCIDAIFASFLNASNYKIANAFNLLSELGRLSSFEHKKEGLYSHAVGTFPYPVLFQDLTLLAISNDKHAHYYLSEIISLYPKTFININYAVGFLSELIYFVLSASISNGYFSKGLRKYSPSNNGYAERVFNACCRVCMQCEDKVEAELAISMLLCKLFSRFYYSPSINKLICLMATEFAQGHFLDIPIINQHIKCYQEKIC